MKPLLLSQKIKSEMMLDEYLEQCFFSRKQRHLLKTEKRIRINTQTVSHNIRLYSGYFIEIDCMKEESDDIVPIERNLKILYEDETVLVAEKPIHLIVHDDGNGCETMDRAVAGYFHRSGQKCPVRHIHRLDRDTSGCILYCKQSLLQPYFDHMMQTKQIRRTYLAIVHGRIDKAMTINKSIGKDRHANRFRIHANGQKAVTHIKPLAYKNGKTLIECQLETGRTHQIRVHLSGISHPLVGDELYGKKEAMRCALHSHTLTFIHPISHQEIIVISEMPSDMYFCMER